MGEYIVYKHTAPNGKGECIRKYKTIADAAHDNNISPSALSHYLSGAQKTLKCEEGIDFIREVQYAEK